MRLIHPTVDAAEINQARNWSRLIEVGLLIRVIPGRWPNPSGGGRAAMVWGTVVSGVDNDVGETLSVRTDLCTDPCECIRYRSTQDAFGNRTIPRAARKVL